MAKSLLFWSITFLAVLKFPICFSSRSVEQYNTCGNYFSCGNVTHVGFPFWGGGLRPRYCGHPQLELSCDNNVSTKMEIMGMKFRILQINQTARIVRIARDDFSQGLCLQKFINTTLDFMLFENVLDNQNITILYGCPPPYGDTLGQFTCRINGINDTASYPELGALGPSSCYASVVVPVLMSLADQIGNLSLGQILKEGFHVKYRVDNSGFLLCSTCEASKGRCGFDVSENKTTCHCPDGTVGLAPCTTASFSALGILVLTTLFAYVTWRHSKSKLRLEVSKPKTKQEVEAFLRQNGVSGPKRYTYTDLKSITNSFKDKIGEGGYGTVYKGRLHTGHQVAVKLLKKSKGDAMQFINEIVTAKTNHKNIVTLLGFCYEGHKQALVYDFMPNGSLEKFIYGGSNDQLLPWEKMFQIAVGIARGLEYLHQGCNTRILHFDIKPHNILLDEDFCPKISDFGLSKPCLQKESIISMSEARGTVGYIAPEVFLRSFGRVSQKSDVYSYGMLVLEMVGCRKNPHAQVECSSEQFFPQWIYNQLEQEAFDHPEILSGGDRDLQRKMVLVSLWCIQTNPHSRPSMTRVVEMLEGSSESLQIPPMPTLDTPPKSLSPQNSSTTGTVTVSTS